MEALVPDIACSIFISKKKIKLAQMKLLLSGKVLPSNVVFTSDGAFSALKVTTASLRHS